jgi:hypothetical protein
MLRVASGGIANTGVGMARWNLAWGMLQFVATSSYMSDVLDQIWWC